MAQSPISKCLALANETEEDNKEYRRMYRHYKDYVLSLPSVEVPEQTLYHYKNMYARLDWMAGMLVAQQLFQAKSSDVILATVLKSGTTWLKALVFATQNRNSSCSPSSILTSRSPHECVPNFEIDVYCENQVPKLSIMPDPRLFSSHVPFEMLPQSVVQSGCKIIYLCREIKDTFISWWHFINRRKQKLHIDQIVPLERALDQFCDGVCFPGSIWDHVLGYWKASQEHPDRVMFMTYEELMGDTASAVRKMAGFIGCPFTMEEDKHNVVDEIVHLCAFENLSNLEVNKTGLTINTAIENSMFFRRGKVGDWVNHLTPEMAKRLDNITMNKFNGTGLLN